MKRFLILTRNFPPVVSGGARRPFLIAKGLEALGASVRVVAPQLPKGIEGVQVPHSAPVEDGDGRFLSDKKTPLRDFVRAHFLLPDPDIRWSLKVSRHTNELDDFNPDVVLSTSPPESIHIAGGKLARQFNAKWIADFRDHWLETPLMSQRQNLARRNIERIMARHILSKVDVLTAPSEAMLQEALAYAPHARRLLLPQPAPTPSNDNPGTLAKDNIGTVVILHTGSFSLSHGPRAIEPVLEFFQTAHKTDPRLELHLAGRLTENEARAAAMVSGVTINGVISMEEAWAAQRQADILLLVAAPGTNITPGKLSEYEVSGKPIVALGGSTWAHDVNQSEEPLSRILRLAHAKTPYRPIQTTKLFTGKDAAQLLLEAIS